ncbi:SDR family oxidoreductase [Streptomyces sp. NBC_01497]|uniref:SDR family oxidoreductase n=1 Tax=Streptomyces sp. NBC_01497 TaxID=2903885 RepID=UPI002E32C6EF|nr:SDR family oxidoreductase [Streptomyces sp. NBC_01497]
MHIENSVALVTGANRGFGRHLTEQLLSRGAAKVYATARDTSTVDLPGVVPLRLDITDPASIAEAAAIASDTTLLVNNAGISTHTNFLSGEMADVRLEMETHYYGTLGMVRAFAPALARNGGGAILNVLSVLSWVHFPNYGAYSAAKAAAWAMTNVVRQELAAQHTDVTALHVGYMDTDMASYVDASDKADPVKVAALALDGIEARALEVIGDDKSRNAKAGLSGAPEDVYVGLPAQR